MNNRWLTFFRQNLFSLPALVVYWIFLTCTIMSPYLFGGRMIAPGADTVSQYYPAFYWFAETLQRGDSFLWNPGTLSGFPTYLSQLSGFIEPLNIILFSTLPFLLAYHLRLSLDYVLVMLFSYLVARRWGISKIAAFCIGPTYLMAFQWLYLSNTVIANSLFLLPFLFWVYVSARASESRVRRIGWAFLGGLAIGWVLLCGYAQFALYTLVLVGLYALYDFFVLTERNKRTMRLAVEMAGVLAVFIVSSVTLALPYILSVFTYAPLGARGGSLDYAATQLKVLRFEEFIYFLFPDYLRIPFIYAGRKPLFIGVLSLILAITAAIHFRKNKLIAGIGGLFSFALIAALPHSPIYFILHQLPVFDLFRFPFRWMYLGTWLLAVLGAFGFDLLRQGLDSRRAKILALLFVVASAILAAFSLMCTFLGDWFWMTISSFLYLIFSTFVYSPAYFPKGIFHYVNAIHDNIEAFRSLGSLANSYFSVAFFSFVGGSILFYLRAWLFITQRVFERVALFLVISTFVGTFAVRWQDSLPSSVFWLGNTTFSELISKSDFQNYRLFHFDPGREFKPRHTVRLWSTEDTLAGVEHAHALAAPNVNLYTGIRLLDGYEPLITRDLMHVTTEYLASTYSTTEIQTKTPQEKEPILLSHLDIIGMMGGKYIVTGAHLSHPELKLLGTVRASRYQVPSYVYEYALAVPRIYLADATEGVSHESVRELVESGRKFGDVVYLDCGTCTSMRSKDGSVSLLKEANGYFDIVVNTQNEEWLIVSESYLPGWKALLDGMPLTPVRANGMYMAFHIPRGEHRLVLQYEGIRGEAKWLYKIGLFPRPPLSE